MRFFTPFYQLDTLNHNLIDQTGNSCIYEVKIIRDSSYSVNDLFTQPPKVNPLLGASLVLWTLSDGGLVTFLV